MTVAAPEEKVEDAAAEYSLWTAPPCIIVTTDPVMAECT